MLFCAGAIPPSACCRKRRRAFVSRWSERPSRVKRCWTSIGSRPIPRCRPSSSWSTRSSTTRWSRALPTFTSRRATPKSRSNTASTARYTPKVDPIDLAYHQTLISRIKVMSELDIAERRVPQDGRFRVRYKGRNVDFRVSIMPTIHGEDAVIRILDKEQINEEFRNLNLDVVGLCRRGSEKVSALHRRAVRHGAGYGPHRLGQNDDALRRAERDPERRRQDHYDRGSG